MHVCVRYVCVCACVNRECINLNRMARKCVSIHKHMCTHKNTPLPKICIVAVLD